MKEDYDGAEPTASSVAVMNLLVLAHLTESSQWSEQIDRTLRLFGTRLEQMGRAVPMMAAALSTSLAGVQQIVLVGADADRGPTCARGGEPVLAVRRHHRHQRQTSG